MAAGPSRRTIVWYALGDVVVVPLVEGRIPRGGFASPGRELCCDRVRAADGSRPIGEGA
jgi:hypothetical protein